MLSDFNFTIQSSKEKRRKGLPSSDTQEADKTGRADKWGGWAQARPSGLGTQHRCCGFLQVEHMPSISWPLPENSRCQTQSRITGLALRNPDQVYLYSREPSIQPSGLKEKQKIGL